MSPNAPATQHHIESESHPIRPHLASFPHSTGRQAQRNSSQPTHRINFPSPSPTTSDARQDAGKSPQLPASCKNRLPCHGTCRHLSMFRDPAPPKSRSSPSESPAATSKLISTFSVIHRLRQDSPPQPSSPLPSARGTRLQWTVPQPEPPASRRRGMLCGCKET